MKALSFEGGGTFGLAHVGAYSVLKNSGKLDDIKHVSGSSAGAMVALAIAIGISPDRLKQELENSDFSEFLDGSWIDAGNIYRLITTYGYYKGEALEKWIFYLTEKYTGNKHITFQELYNLTGVDLMVTASNVSSGKTVYMDRKHFPNFSVAKAAKISSTIPILFKPEIYDGLAVYCKNSKNEIVKPGDILVDGGVYENFPISYYYQFFPDEDPHVIAFDFIAKDDHYNYRAKISNVRSFAMAIFNGIFTSHGALVKSLLSDDKVSYVDIDTSMFDSLNFDLTQADKDLLFKAGTDAGDKWLEKHRNGYTEVEEYC
jgi:predicted acylesterase/phospholipase RssA